MTGIEATACACELLYVYIYVYVTLHRKLRWMRCGSTKHRKGPQRTAKELRNTAKDPRNIAKGPQRTTKDRKGAPKYRKGPQRTPETSQKDRKGAPKLRKGPQRTPETSQKDRKGTPQRDRRLLETRRLLEHENFSTPGVCCMSGLPCAKSVLRSLIDSVHCVVTPLGLFLSVCGWSQA